MNSIKPPDGRPIAVPTAGAGAGEPGAAERTGGPSFREALERAGGAPAAGPTAGASAAPQTAAADPVAELARAVRSGALNADQAVDRLVERAIASVGGQLSTAQRGELAVVLREALQSDPALRDLRDAVK